MRITHVELPVPDPAASAAFYADVLGARTSSAPGRGRGAGRGATLHLGATALDLVEDADVDPSAFHLALAVPGDAGQRAHDWLRDRVQLLPHDGSTLHEGGPAWDSQSVYFRAPDGTVLELIARRRSPVSLGGEHFGADAVLGLSEVGLVVPDVPLAAAELHRVLGVQAFAGAPSPGFGAVGDDDGLLVLVPEGRAWFPTGDAVARAAAVHVRLTGVRAGTVLVNGMATVTGAP